MFIGVVYISLSADANGVLREPHNNIYSLQNKHLDAFYVIAGDFNHVNLKDTLPKLHQHVTIASSHNNTLDRVYTNRQGTCRAIPHPHFGLSDHISIMLVSAFCPVLKSSKPTQKNITVWPSGDVDQEL